MARQNVHRRDETGGLVLDGWFDPNSATRYDQGTEWDGANNIGVITGSQWVDEYLYRTAGGRWVLHHDEHRAAGGSDVWEYVGDEQARDWLARSEINDDALAEHFGPIEPERGRGRPEIGPAVLARYPADLLARIDQAAAFAGMTRPAWLRQAAEQVLASA